ncbi:hypothetical protein [Phaeodactylibacter sp.]|uniref:hypothetical protein n=2 Tax=Phaeodactylibacter sp. TaxID=1940289 RepID=UPI0025CFDDEA|nr:hypothetical protein [Phaeodactylibacter sp.]
MHKFYVFLLVCCPLLMQSMPWPGYILSKNGKKLTGHIGVMQHQSRTSTIVFINGFGDTYEIEAERIKGFAFEAQGRLFAFESKDLQHAHRFLRILHKNGPMELFVLTYDSGSSWAYTLQTLPSIQRSYWIRLQGEETMVKVSRWGFRRKLRRLLGPKASALAEKIGQKGYRFDDMPRIAEIYNHLLTPRPKPIEL